MNYSLAISGMNKMDLTPKVNPMDEAAGLIGADKPKKLSPEELDRFANYIPSGQLTDIAKDLNRRGLKNADQITNAAVTADTSTNKGIGASQGAWKPAAFVKLIEKARAAGIKSPAELMANKDYLLSGLDERYKSAINTDVFNQVHPNWWEKVSEVYMEQLKKEI